ncbi:hypothetical protein ERO13_D06G046000v2 [Gossypium hirsutum]|uniref:Two-component response regulator ORR9 n=4 Tax=Gossypium TaxID=3633 RepID=A0A1U8J3Z0_GOSHI|nr:two-component response regulator ORR9 [Gossypium hirsutum]KAG4140901.1 hypothetical protein ERO13_D06G046000v2 [Gossypium hirsutum]TYG63775.1 hypothetical protein ES288_D06G056800v1 [Gossypium darwinii]TYH65466.1 hypothetical protein ES332_D06G058100v1 [Gossypium tomentosum]
MELMKSSDNIIQDRTQQQHKQEPEMQAQEGQQEQGHHFHVLAVDDSVIDRKLLEKLLKVSSYQVTCVDSGDKALEYLGLLNNLDSDSTASSSSPSSSSSSSSSSSNSSSCSQSSQREGLKVNLIMTDFCMPGMSGYDLLKRLKGSSWKDVPVVVMSSENVPSRISMCLEGGAEEFMLKPLQLSDLEKIEAYLLKSLHLSCTNIDKDDDDNNADHNSDNNNDKVVNNDSNIDKGNNSTSMNNNFSKRKALSSEDTESRRPKIKGLAVAI